MVGEKRPPAVDDLCQILTADVEMRDQPGEGARGDNNTVIAHPGRQSGRQIGGLADKQHIGLRPRRDNIYA